jgi:hypothetical protein
MGAKLAVRPVELMPTADGNSDSRSISIGPSVQHLHKMMDGFEKR